MLTQDRVQAIEALFEASDKAFDTRDNKYGSLKLWEAAEAALSIVAENRGLPCQNEDDHFDLLELLMAESARTDDDYDLVSGYLVAGFVQNNVGYEFMEDYLLESSRRSVRRFVKELLSFSGQMPT